MALAVEYDPLRDKSYQHTRLGSSVVDFLAWKKMGGAAERTLDQYERDLARGCLMYPNTPLEAFSDSQMLHVAGAFHDAERRVRVAAWRSFFKWALRTRRISVNPTDALPEMKQPPQRVIDVFSDAEVAVLEELPLRDGRWYVAPPQRLGDFLEGHLEREQNRVKPSTWKRNREALRALGVLNK